MRSSCLYLCPLSLPFQGTDSFPAWHLSVSGLPGPQSWYSCVNSCTQRAAPVPAGGGGRVSAPAAAPRAHGDTEGTWGHCQHRSCPLCLGPGHLCCTHPRELTCSLAQPGPLSSLPLPGPLWWSWGPASHRPLARESLTQGLHPRTPN